MSAAPARRRRAADETRAEIMEAAARRFGERGYAATRLEDVGRDVGIGRSAVLYHFKDKRQLYRAVLERHFVGLLEQTRTVFARPGTLDERLEAAVGVYIDYMARNLVGARLAAREFVSPEAPVRSELQEQTRPFLRILDALIEEGERSGVMEPGRADAVHLVSIVSGATVFYLTALPTYLSELPYDPLAPDRLNAFRREILAITRRQLGFRKPRRWRGDRTKEREIGTRTSGV